MTTEDLPPVLIIPLDLTLDPRIHRGQRLLYHTHHKAHPISFEG